MQRITFTLVALLYLSTVGAQAPVSVTVSSGPIVGQSVDGQVASFLGVPYAQPPINSLRWKPPIAPVAWSSPLNTTQFGPSCIQLSDLKLLSPQLSFAPFSEDCLTINIWAPLSGDGTIDTTAKLPVMLFIPGGGFIVGGTRGQDGTNLSVAGPAVVVTANYRLGVFGFLALEQLIAEDPDFPTTGNYGILDQMFALQWLKKNAAQFGGDPDNIMIFGQSAGGNSMFAHLVSPLTSGLMSKIGIESGFFRGFFTLADALPPSENILPASGCSASSDPLSCLRALDAETLQNMTQRCQWLPTIDGVVIPDWPDLLVQSGKFNQVPVMIGGVRNEGTLTIGTSFKCSFGPTLYPTYTRTLFTPFIGLSAANEVVKQYQPSQFNATANGTSSYWALSGAFGDWNILCSSAYFADLLTQAGVSVYGWTFSYPPPPSVTTRVYNIPECPLGAWHGSEIPYAWNLFLPNDPQQQVLSKNTQSAWLNFAAKSAPGPVAGIQWPSWTGDGTSPSLNFNLPSCSLQQELGIPQRCAFWKTIPIYTPSELLPNCIATN